MTASVCLSARVSPQVRARLAAAAAERGVPLATYASQLLSAPVMDAPRPGAGAVTLEVECIFSHLPDGAGLEREICMALARTVEQGGTPGIGAARELLNEVRMAEIRYASDEDEDEDEDEDWGASDP